MNNLKTGLLLGLLTLALVGFGSMFGGRTGAMVALGLAAVMNLGAYWFSDKLVLKMYRARPVTEAEAPELWSIVADLAQRAMLPMPRVYVIPNEALNAFATGRNPSHAAVAVTEGLMRHMNRSEITAVLAHELSHVKHRDILIGTVAATLAGAVGILADMARWGAIFGGMRGNDDRGGSNPLAMIFVAMFAGLAAMLVQMAISRSREFEADAGAARLLGDPSPMISALRKLELGAQRIPMHANQATAHMFIVSPLSGGGLMKMFSTHPPIEERVRRLQALTGMPHL
jgi:heat shock protein HtpX